ncbi:MAG: hypothetical protein CL943_03610 [Candidatus Diapherotrites archaeon]|uniref:CARDB domain-containing protein n=1 Tax=Candidatus Iainarchaeum sp. TaxID=3101447 RepID=A0A2D6M1Q6_9ARCH|nr:hypothetical protein [Candidatus Diapherotrites archaeon]|tara:strand:+ start:4599 stop:6530 length:1932 start_codon:yes stop_codon:yes gene_type:complete
MASPFRLLVYAIGAMLLIGLFVTYIAPLFSQQQDPIEIMHTSLNVAETNLGVGHNQNIVFEEIVFSALSFDTDNRSVAFECNDPRFCCNKGEQDDKCTQKIVWDERKVEITDSVEVETTTRCSFENTLFVCRVYFGEAPAQVSISEAEIKERINLDDEPVELKVKIENSGSLPMFASSMKVEVFERYLDGQRWKRRYIGSALLQQDLGEIVAGQSIEKKIALNIPFAGKYDVELHIKGDKAGFEKQEFSFEAIGGDKCRATSCEKPVMEFGQCKTECNCANCFISTNCEQKVKSTIKQVPFGETTLEVDLGGRNSETLGSNLVGISLPDEYCPADIVIEEPSAPYNIIGFNVKNKSENEVKEGFTVVAYLDFGQPSQVAIGSVEVEANEINDGNEALKAITTTLSTGTHEITLIANPERERSQVETNYNNNLAAISVIIEPPPTNPIIDFGNPGVLGKCCGKEIKIIKLTTQDDSDAITLREAIKDKKVNVDIRGNFPLYLRIQNISKKNLKIKVPAGQTFVDRDGVTQNLGKEFEDLIFELPICSVWTGTTSVSCLNRSKAAPYFTNYDIGEVAKEESVLAALANASQEAVWAATSTLFPPAGAGYAMQGEILREGQHYMPTNLAANVDIPTTTCIAEKLFG